MPPRPPHSSAADEHNITDGNATAQPPEIDLLVSRYVDQILHGCNNAECRQAMCHTGRLNTSDRPVRGYTIRSARAIALTICCRPNPRQFLCKHGEATHNEPTSSGEPGDYDTSSLVQLLCSTLPIQQCRAPDGSQAEELRHFHQKLQRAWEHADGRSAAAGDTLLSNSHLADLLMPCVEWLISKLPSQRPAVWEMLDLEIVSRGRAFPQKTESRPTDDNYNSWLVALDILDHEPYLRLLRRIVQVVCLRMHLEDQLYRVRSHLDGHEKAMAKATISIVSKFVVAFMEKRANRENLYALVVWLKKLFAREWDSTPVLESGSLSHGILEMLATLWSATDGTALIPENAFMIPLIRGRSSEVDLALPYLDDAGSQAIKLLEYRFALPVDELFLCFRTVNHLTMRRAHSAALKAVALRQRVQSDAIVHINNLPSQVQHYEEHYLLLNVTRTNVLHDTFDQLWQRRKAELRRPLRVRLGQTDELEVGHDLGGVQIEFFNLVCREMLSDGLQMFTTDFKTGLSYLPPCSLQPIHLFEQCGLLFALAAYNGITLPVRLPWLFYHILLEPPGAVHLDAEIDLETLLRTLQEGWPTTAASLRSILNQDIFGLDFELPLEANGLRMSVLPPNDDPAATKRELRVVNATPILHHEAGTDLTKQDMSERSQEAFIQPLPLAWPGWTITASHEEPEEVTAANKVFYVQTYARWLCYSSVAPQFDAFRRGFHGSILFPNDALSILGASHFKAYIEGTDTFDVADLKAAAKYDGFDPRSRYIQAFWKIVAAWPEAKQRQLLKFVTAAERIPVTGVAKLTFIIKRANVDNLENLPTSSTCFGTLMLPKYKSPETMQEKLSLALKFGTEGFGTG